MKWVSRHDSGKWEAKALVGSCSKFIKLGLFDTEQQAIAAYHRAMAKMGTQGASKPAAQPGHPSSHQSPRHNSSTQPPRKGPWQDHNYLRDLRKN